MIIITKVVEILNFKRQEEYLMNYIIIVANCDCIVSFYTFCGTEKDMLSVLKKKAEERRQILAERPEYVTDIEYDELTSSWYINILSDNLEMTESITAKPVDLIECLYA